MHTKFWSEKTKYFSIYFWSWSQSNKWPVSVSRLYPFSRLFNGRPGLLLVRQQSRSCFPYTCTLLYVYHLCQDTLV